MNVFEGFLGDFFCLDFLGIFFGFWVLVCLGFVFVFAGGR